MGKPKDRNGPGSLLDRLLSSLCQAGKDQKAFGRDASAVRLEAHQCIDHILERAGLGRVMVVQFRWYVDDLAAALSSDEGVALRYELEAILAKWRRYSMEPNTLVLVLRILVRELSGVDVPDRVAEPATLKVTRHPKLPAAA
jgi:hypothetical protein